MKTIEERIQEKLESIKKIDINYEMTLSLYETLTSTYQEAYNQAGSNVNSTHINGISALLGQMNNLIKTKNEIQNEIALLSEENNLTENQDKKENNIISFGNKDQLLEVLRK